MAAFPYSRPHSMQLMHIMGPTLFATSSLADGKTDSNDPFGFPRANLKVNCIDFRFWRVDGHLRQQSKLVLNFLSLWYTKHIPISMQLSSRTAHGHRLQTKSHVPTRRISWHQRHALPRKTGLKPPNRLMRKNHSPSLFYRWRHHVRKLIGSSAPAVYLYRCGNDSI